MNLRQFPKSLLPTPYTLSQAKLGFIPKKRGNPIGPIGLAGAAAAAAMYQSLRKGLVLLDAKQKDRLFDTMDKYQSLRRGVVLSDSRLG